MSQEIKIGIKGDASGLERESKDAEKALDGLARAANRLGQTTGASKLADQLDHLAKVQSALSREMKRPISTTDTQRFLGRFDAMRMRSPSLRRFDDFESWYQGHRTLYGKRGQAAKHRRTVLAVGMQGTDDAAANGGSDDGGGGGGGGGGLFGGGGPAKALGLAKGMVMGSLALAGIGGVMSLLSKGVGSATDTSIGADTLKREMGDVGLSFRLLREEAEAAGKGLGVSASESVRLAQQYAREAGNLTAQDQTQLDTRLRTGIGMSRSYGLDPSEGVGFFGSMARLGVGRDDQSQRRLALLIADAIAQGGYGGKADEVLAAISNFAQQAARLTFSSPNVGAFAAALTSMTGTGYPGLDPQGAAGVLGAADSAVRRGGADGQAGFNFSYMALARGLPHINPIIAQSLLAGGLFATTRSIFGDDPGKVKGADHTLMGDYLRGAGKGGLIPQISDTTNADRLLPALQSQYGPVYALDAAKNYFGLNSTNQAAALFQMQRLHQLGGSEKLLKAAGVDLKDVSATGLATIGQLSATQGLGGVRGLLGNILQRTDLSQDERTKLTDAGKLTDAEQMKEAIARVVATKEQEQTEGSKTRDSIKELETTLTKVGDLLLEPLNVIRVVAVAIGEKLGLGGQMRADQMAQKGNWIGALQASEDSKNNDPFFYQVKPGQDPVGDLNEAMGKRGPAGVDLDKIMPHYSGNDPLGHRALVQNAQRQRLEQLRDGPLATQRAMMAYLMKDQHLDVDTAAALIGNAWAESKFKTDAKGPDGHDHGLFQWRDNKRGGFRWQKFLAWAKAKGLNSNDWRTQLRYASEDLNYNHVGAAMAKLQGPGEKGLAFQKLYEAPLVEDPARYNFSKNAAASVQGAQTGGVQHVKVSFDPATVRIHHPGGVSTASLTPVQAPAAAGTSH